MKCTYKACTATGQKIIFPIRFISHLINIVHIVTCTIRNN